jgi:HlyD family secretion protein
MKRNHIIAGVAAIALVLVAAWFFRRAEASTGSPYRLAQVERGDVEMSITSTGTLNPVTTVQVGTQVSGKVTALYADFNDRVSEGQLIARIDPTLQQQAVREAESSLRRAQADLERAEREFDRNKALHEQQVITDSEFNQIEYNLAVSRASFTSAQVSLERARQNLAYTEIYSPIDGIVVERNVEPGQTVAASMSAPQLFLIANDLAEMEILASVDESDIGKIKDGQTVRFSVQAYPDEDFVGTVRQVRLQSATLENVVNYTAVVAVQNQTGRLLPGMTATVYFLVEKAENVLKVPNAALRLRPTEEMLAQVDMPAMGGANGARGDSATRAAARAARQQQGAAAGQGGAAGAGREGGQAGAARQGANGGQAGAGRTGGFGPGGFAGAGGRRPGGGNFAMLWTVDEAGKLAVIPVRTGISDNTTTEVQGPGLTEGMQVIAGLNTVGEETETVNPFQQGRAGQGGPGGPGGFRPGGF